MDFQGFPKMPRLSRDILITEKIDGTNAQIAVFEVPPFVESPEKAIYRLGDTIMFAGSKNRWITPDDDNMGFAKWCRDNAEELIKLGPGRHYGEWWGKGIQRGYGMTEKVFSLFNVSRWSFERPVCCRVVPVLYEGPFAEFCIDDSLEQLAMAGSYASPGYTSPEGIVIFHTAANMCFKKTIRNDDKPKSQVTV